MHSDTPAQKDLLNRRPFANQIGKRLVNSFENNHESVVLGINGPWGCGKSTLMGYLKDSVEEECANSNIKYVTYDFNPWMISNQEALQKEFLEGLFHKFQILFKQLNNFHTLLEKNKKYIELISIFSNKGDRIAEAAEKLAKGISTVRSLQDLKGMVDMLLVDKKTRLFVFIDDVDRLSPEEVVEVFKLVKLNTNFKNTVFIVAYDRTVVEHALQHKYGANSGRYLEKIIQFDFKVPEMLPEQSQNLFVSELDVFLKKEQIDFDVQVFDTIWKKAELYNIFRSMRDIYRYVNAISFSLPAIINDIHIEDFLLIEMIRLFDPEAYERLYMDTMSKQNTYQWYFAEQKQVDGFSQKTQPIVNVLLPSKDGFAVAKNRGDKRYADSAFTERYFAWQISSYDISEKEFEDFLSAKDKKAILENMARGERLGSFFSRLTKVHSYEISMDLDYFQIFDSILNLLEDESLQNKWGTTTFHAIGQVLKSTTDYFGVGAIYMDALSRDVSRFSSSRYLFIHWVLDDFKQNYDKEEPKVQTFIEKHRLTLQVSLNNYHEKWMFHILSPSTWQNPPSMIILPTLYYAKNKSDEYASHMAKILETDKGIVELSRFLAMFIDDNGRPRRYNSDTYSQLLFPPLDQTYKHRLKDVLDILPDGRDRLLVEFMKEALNEH